MMLVSVSLISRHLLLAAGSLEIQDLRISMRISLTRLQRPRWTTKLFAANAATYTFQIRPTCASGVATRDQGFSRGGWIYMPVCRVDWGPKSCLNSVTVFLLVFISFRPSLPFPNSPNAKWRPSLLRCRTKLLDHSQAVGGWVEGGSGLNWVKMLSVKC